MHDTREVAELGIETFLPSLDACMTLDTIEEAKESYVSSDSNETLNTSSQLEENPKYETGEKSDFESTETRVKVHIANDDDDDDDDDEDMMSNEGDLHEAKSWNHSDIDGGWAWVILGSFFIIFVITSGLLGGTGLYYVQMLQEFQQSRSYTAWMGSLINAFYMLAGPVCSVFIKKFGCRASIMTGGVTMSVGYLMSAFAQSLPVIFLTYGIIVACGMNFVYSGQIISLTKYFVKRHSLATALAMIGIGLGMFTIVRILEQIIIEYGWRISFIICAGFSLHICVFGALVFPLKEDDVIDEIIAEDIRECCSQNSLNFSPSHYRKRSLYQGALLNRSVSSLRLSIGAGYLSSSFSTLNGEVRSGNCTIGSNPHSFCSRGSQNFGGLRSGQQSFAHLPNSDMSGALLPFLRSNQHSFCSRGSFYLHHGSNLNRNSHVDLNHFGHHHSQLGTPRDANEEKKHREKLFYLEVGSKQSDLSQWKENEDQTSKCKLFIKKLEDVLTGVIGEHHLEVLVDLSFWLMNFALFFNYLANVKLLVVYQDLSVYLGVGDYFLYAISIIGIGDIVGRLCAGILSSREGINSVVHYSLALFCGGASVACLFFSTTMPIFMIVSGCFGFFYGQQNVLITLIPTVLFGKEKLVTVFGYVLFFAGAGGLFGAPLAGLIVDRTGSYTGVIVLSVTCNVIAGVCLLGCNSLSTRKKDDQTTDSSYCV